MMGIRLFLLTQACSLLLLIFSSFYQPAATAATSNSGAAFLKLGIGARALAIGGGYAAIANDVSAIYWNPGGLSQVERPEVAGMYTEWISDVRYEFIGYAQPTKVGTFGLGLMYLHMGAMERRGANRELLDGTFTAHDFAATLSYSKCLFSNSSVGVNFKLIRQTIEAASANGIALDIGLLQKTVMKDLNVGIVIQNIGPRMKFVNVGYNLPLTIIASVAYNLYGIFNIGANLNYLVFDSRATANLGMELWLGPVALRARYGHVYSLLGEDTRSKIDVNDLSSFGIGLGVKINRYQLDYTFIPYGELGDTHRLTFGIKL